jgi:hypothetical protein
MGQTDPWSTHRWLKRIGVVSIAFLFLIFALGVGGLINARSNGLNAIFFCWMIVVLIMLITTNEVKCPRCGQRFYAKGSEFSQVTRRCLHCGQKKYADVTPESKAVDSD